MNPPSAQILPARAARLELEIDIQAPLERVWKAVIEEPDAWWCAEMRCVPDGSKIALEPRAGGHFVEANDRGGSLLWFTVIAVDPPRSINLAGSLAPPFGGPSGAFLLIELEETEAGTKVKMTNTLHGHVDEDSLPQMDGGWRMLLKGLRDHVQKTAR